MDEERILAISNRNICKIICLVDEVWSSWICAS